MSVFIPTVLWGVFSVEPARPLIRQMGRAGRLDQAGTDRGHLQEPMFLPDRDHRSVMVPMRLLGSVRPDGRAESVTKNGQTPLTHRHKIHTLSSENQEASFLSDLVFSTLTCDLMYW